MSVAGESLRPPHPPHQIVCCCSHCCVVLRRCRTPYIYNYNYIYLTLFSSFYSRIEEWNVTQLTSMYQLFYHEGDQHQQMQCNPNISMWNVQRVTNFVRSCCVFVFALPSFSGGWLSVCDDDLPPLGILILIAVTVFFLFLVGWMDGTYNTNTKYY